MYFINGSNVIDKARSFPNQLHIDTTSPALFQPVKSHFLKIFDKIHHSMRCLQLRVTVTLGMRCCEEAARGLERSKGGRPFRNAYAALQHKTADENRTEF